MKKNNKEVSSINNINDNEKNKHIKWDEDIIKEHDKLRGTRMKIDEPDTPYNKSYQNDQFIIDDEFQLDNLDDDDNAVFYFKKSIDGSAIFLLSIKNIGKQKQKKAGTT